MLFIHVEQANRLLPSMRFAVPKDAEAGSGVCIPGKVARQKDYALLRSFIDAAMGLPGGMPWVPLQLVKDSSPSNPVVQAKQQQLEKQFAAGIKVSEEQKEELLVSVEVVAARDYAKGMKLRKYRYGPKAVQ